MNAELLEVCLFSDDIHNLRTRIDEIDVAIIELIEKRAKIVEGIASVKANHNLYIRDFAREEQHLNSLLELDAAKQLPADYLQTIYGLLSTMAVEIQLQRIQRYPQPRFGYALDMTKPIMPKVPNVQKFNIAYQGEPGSFSHMTISILFPNSEAIGLNQFETVGKALMYDYIDFAILPFFNSNAGTVTNGLKVIDTNENLVLYKFPLPVQHFLAAPPYVDTISEIKAVYSHPEALKQCSNFLRQHDLEGKECSDTATAARYISEVKPKGAAAICSKLALQMYNLKPIAASIQNDPFNYTLFAMVLHYSKLPTVIDKLKTKSNH